MLKNIDPLLSPELLMILRSMGHGDDIAIVDGNFPADSMAQRLVRLDGLSATAVANAILSVMPLDDFVPEAAWRMEVVGDPSAEQPIFAEFRAIIAQHEGPNFRPRRTRALRLLRARQGGLRHRVDGRGAALREPHPAQGHRQADLRRVRHFPRHGQARPGHHVFSMNGKKGVDARPKAGHDGMRSKEQAQTKWPGLVPAMRVFDRQPTKRQVPAPMQVAAFCGVQTSRPV